MIAPPQNTISKRLSNPDGRKAFDLTGQKFNMLRVIDLHHKTYGNYHWNCICDCGRSKVVRTAMLLHGVKSCGCILRTHPPQLRHGHCRKGNATLTHKSWQGMMSRCYRPSTQRFADWGGRGIRVCERWHTFDNFLADMGVAPPGTSIDRYPDNDGNYEPGNCRWATPKQQGANKRPYRPLHARVCTVCGREFMAVMPRALRCSNACRNLHAVAVMRKKRTELC